MCGVAVSCQWGSPQIDCSWWMLVLVLPDQSGLGFSVLILSANSNMDDSKKKKRKKKCSSSRLGIPITWSSLRVQRLPFHDHKNRWLILKNTVNSDNARKKTTTSQCLLNMFMKWSPGCLAKKIFTWYHIRCFFFSGVNSHWPTPPVFGSSSVSTRPHSLDINGLWKGSACLLSDLCFLQVSLFIRRLTWSESF